MVDVGDRTHSKKRSHEDMEEDGGPIFDHVPDPFKQPVSSGTYQTPDYTQSSYLEDGPKPKKARMEVTTNPLLEDNEKNSEAMLEDSAVSFSSAASPDVEKFYSPKEDVCHDETLYLIAGILCVRPTTREYFDGLKVQQKLMKRLKELLEKERRYEDDLEMAELVYLLKLLSPSNPMLETFGKKAGKGAMMLLEGDRIMTEGRDLLRSAITDI